MEEGGGGVGGGGFFCPLAHGCAPAPDHTRPCTTHPWPLLLRHASVVVFLTPDKSRGMLPWWPCSFRFRQRPHVPGGDARVDPTAYPAQWTRGSIPLKFDLYLAPLFLPFFPFFLALSASSCLFVRAGALPAVAILPSLQSPLKVREAHFLPFARRARGDVSITDFKFRAPGARSSRI